MRATVNNSWVPALNAQEESSLDHVPINFGHCSSSPLIGYPLASEGSSLGIPINTPIPFCTNATVAHTNGHKPTDGDVISVDTDSDDEVIFVNSHQPLAVIPIIDLSDHSSQSDNIIRPDRSITGRRDTRKRTYDNTLDSPATAPAAKEKSPEKQFRHSCAVCLEDVKAPHSTTCGHIYCGECIKNSIKIFKKCPTCNKKLKISHVHPIYL